MVRNPFGDIIVNYIHTKIDGAKFAGMETFR